MLSILRRELKGYFDSLGGYGILAAFVVVMMLLSLLLDPDQQGDWFKRGELSMRSFFRVFPWVAAVVMPAVSMRLWSEDRRQATFELLMTLPLSTWRVALGKYLAALVFLVAMLASTVAFPLLLAAWGTPDWGPVLGGYLACFLLGAAFAAIGLFVSGLTENQALAFFGGMLMCIGIVSVGKLLPEFGDLARWNPNAALVHLVSLPIVALAVLAAVAGRDALVGGVAGVLGFVANTAVYLLDAGAEVTGKDVRATTPAAEGVIAALGQASVLEHFREIERGVVNTNGLVFFASLVVLFVFLNVWSLESRRHC
ncbi:MAG: ABC-2 transporter permease [Planctomycetes bacterium]|nr:ABC-2 transporter permease [Planctomycetota bacterium]